MTGHIAAMRAEPWGEERADYRTAFLVWWMINLWGSSEKGKNPEAEDLLQDLHLFIDKRSTKEETVRLSPDEAAKRSKGIF